MLMRYHNFLSRRLDFDPANCIVTTLSVVADATLRFHTLACDKSEESFVPRARGCKWEAFGCVRGGELSHCTWSHECSWCGCRDKDGQHVHVGVSGRGESGCMSFSSSSSVNQQRSCGWHQWSTSHRVEGWVQVATVGPLSFAICRSLCFEVVEILDVYVCMHCARQP